MKNRGPDAVVLILSWIITLFTLWQMVEMHEMMPGVRFDRYHELGQHAFGPKLGLYIIVPQQLLVEVGTCIAYMVTGGKSLKKVQETLCPTCTQIRTSYWIVIFASVNFVLFLLSLLLQLSCLFRNIIQLLYLSIIIYIHILFFLSVGIKFYKFIYLYHHKIYKF